MVMFYWKRMQKPIYESPYTRASASIFIWISTNILRMTVFEWKSDDKGL